MPDSDRPTERNTTCAHPVADHWHGTLVCHNMDLCRCDDCRAANRRYERLRKSWIGEFPRTPPPFVDPGPVIEHIQELRGQGMGMKRIAEVAGVAASAIGHIIYGRRGSEARAAEKMRRVTAERILAVELDLADGAKVPRAEADQIVDELQARGWWKAEIGRRVHGEQAVSLQIGRGREVMAGTIRTLRVLLDEPVPLKVHTPTGKLYRPKTDHKPRQVPTVTPGVPDDWTPRSDPWLKEMRLGLKKAVEVSYTRHGRFAA